MITILSAPEDTESLRALVERRRQAYLWGKPHMITPRLVATVFGDGKQLIGLAPIDYRPNHFVIRVDSGWNISNHAQDCELLIDHIDEIYDAIEDEYYDWPWWRAYGLKRDRERGDDLSAAIDFSCGSAWWLEEWPEPKKPKRKR